VGEKKCDTNKTAEMENAGLEAGVDRRGENMQE